MKPTRLLYTAAFLTGMGLVFACNKNNATGGSGSNGADLATQADDQAQVSSEDNALSNDVNTVLYTDPTIAGTSAFSSSVSGTTQVNSTTQVNGVQGPILNLICDASVVINKDSATRMEKSYATSEGFGERLEHAPPLTWLLFDECWDGLHEHPRFKVLLEKIGFTKVMPARRQ